MQRLLKELEQEKSVCRKAVYNEKGEEKNEFFDSFVNRVILYDDKVIILYNSNDRETKRLNKNQLKDIESGKNLEEIKENSFEQSEFKRVALGGTD